MRKVNREIDIAYIKDMLMYANRAKEVVKKADRYGIPLDDDMVISAIAMNLGQIGEQLATGKLSDETKEKYSHVVDWSAIKGFRNVIYHDYGRLNFSMIKHILGVSLTQTEEQLHYILRQLEKEKY